MKRVGFPRILLLFVAMQFVFVDFLRHEHCDHLGHSHQVATLSESLEGPEPELEQEERSCLLCAHSSLVGLLPERAQNQDAFCFVDLSKNPSPVIDLVLQDLYLLAPKTSPPLQA